VNADLLPFFHAESALLTLKIKAAPEERNVCNDGSDIYIGIVEQTNT
jgi:hypothetical protein